MPIEIVNPEIIVVADAVRNGAAGFRIERRHFGIVIGEKCDSPLKMWENPVAPSVEDFQIFSHPEAAFAGEKEAGAG